MEEQFDSPHRSERVVFETDTHVVVGNLMLPAHGYQGRLSDQVNRAEVAFLPLVDAEVSPRGGGTVQRHRFLLLAKAYVRFAHPVESE